LSRQLKNPTVTSFESAVKWKLLIRCCE